MFPVKLCTESECTSRREVSQRKDLQSDGGCFLYNYVPNPNALRGQILPKEMGINGAQDVALEPTPVRVWQGHRSTIELY
jgi:hypothetical protein